MNTARFSILALAVCGLPVTAAEKDCEPSKWGEADEIGSANLITAESVLAASKLIKTGKTYSLGITIDSATPAFPPRGLALQVVQPGQQQGRAAFPNMAYNDDLVQTWLGIGSQIDGLGHLGAPGGVYYNCNRAEDFGVSRRILEQGAAIESQADYDAFKAALVSVMPVIGVQAGFVLGGAVYIETVFQWPGVGRMLVQAISTRDILLVQGGVVVVSACYVLFNLLVDLAQCWLDPRIQT